MTATVGLPVAYVVPAHRGRGTLHIARPSGRWRNGRELLSTEALCRTSVASHIHKGTRVPTSVPQDRQAPTCAGCIALAVGQVRLPSAT